MKMFISLPSEFLTNGKPFHSRLIFKSYFVLTWTWFLIKSCITFNLISKPILRSSWKRSTVGILSRTWKLTPSNNLSSLRSTYFRTCLFKLQCRCIRTRPWLGILQLTGTILGSHRESCLVFINSLSSRRVISWTRSIILSKRIYLRFNSHTYFRPLLAWTDVVLARSRIALEFILISQSCANSISTHIYFQEGACLPTLAPEL